MTERPIIFSAPDVRAILDGRKTQTRRVLKPQPSTDFLARGVVGVVPQWPLQNGVRWFMADGMSELLACPFGSPGDALWVRETWLPRAQGTKAVYRADLDPPEAAGVAGMYGGWRPSTTMPRWASRITLELTNVQVQRVQEITIDEVAAEGLPTKLRAQFKGRWNFLNPKHPWDSNPWVWVLEFRRIKL